MSQSTTNPPVDRRPRDPRGWWAALGRTIKHAWLVMSWVERVVVITVVIVIWVVLPIVFPADADAAVVALLPMVDARAVGG